MLNLIKAIIVFTFFVVTIANFLENTAKNHDLTAIVFFFLNNFNQFKIYLTISNKREKYFNQKLESKWSRLIAA